MKMKPTLSTPSTLLLGIWNQNSLCAVKGAYRNGAGELITGIYQNYDAHPWRLLNESLADCLAMKLSNLVMVCNDQDMVRMFTRPIRLPALTTKEIIIPVQGWSKEPATIRNRHGVTSRHDLMRITIEGQKTGAYKAETMDEADEDLWSFARILMRFDRWMMVYSMSIPATFLYWQECQVAPTIYPDFDNPFD